MKILVTHQKGGVGKSTVTVALANYFLSEGVRPAIVDMDFQGSITTFSALYESKGIDVYTRLSIQEIEQLQNKVVIIDTPPYLYDGVKDFKDKINFVIVPLIMNLYDTGAVGGTIKLLEENGLINKSFLLLNKNDNAREKKNLEVIEDLKKHPITVLNNRFDKTVQFERVTEGQYEQKAKIQVENVISEIIEVQQNKQ